MKALILAGGRGTRAHPYTEEMPKPMMPVGGKPIVVRVMQIFASQGVTDFVLSLGYRRDVFAAYFAHHTFGWRVELVDTGENADTGERVRLCRDRLGPEFFVTYADGLCDVDLARLRAFHRGHDGTATVTNVPLRSQYGTLERDASGRVRAFREKPVLPEHRVNAGYCVMDEAVFDLWRGRSLEREVFPALLAHEKLYSYDHDGFFQSMDTFKDQQELEAMFETGELDWIERSPPSPA